MFNEFTTFAVNKANEAVNWVFSDPTNMVQAVVGIAVVGVVIGVVRSLGWCKHTKHSGMRVL